MAQKGSKKFIKLDDKRNGRNQRIEKGSHNVKLNKSIAVVKDSIPQANDDFYSFWLKRVSTRIKDPSISTKD